MNVAKTETRQSKAKVEAQMAEAVACILLNALRDECAIVKSDAQIVEAESIARMNQAKIGDQMKRSETEAW